MGSVSSPLGLGERAGWHEVQVQTPTAGCMPAPRLSDLPTALSPRVGSPGPASVGEGKGRPRARLTWVILLWTEDTIAEEIWPSFS